MRLKYWFSSSKFFVIALILAIGLLVFIGSTTYKQIKQLRYAADMVTHTLVVEKEINSLFSQYAMMQSKAFESMLRTDSLNTDTFEGFKRTSDSIFGGLQNLTQDNPTQQRYLNEAHTVQQELYASLENMFLKAQNSPEARKDFSEAVSPISAGVRKLESLRNKMLSEEEDLMKLREKGYRSSFFFTPLLTLLLGMFALTIFLFSFLRINTERKRTEQSRAFVESILKGSPNIVSHFEPVFNRKKELIDFTFLFTSEQISDISDNSQNSFIGTKLTDKFPMVVENGLLEAMKTCLLTGQQQEHEALYEFGEEKLWFVNTINKLGNGVTNTGRNNTAEKETEERLRTLNEQLEKQNLLLLEGRGFLNNIFKSTSNVVMNLASVRNKKGKIVDFEILFINNAINEVTGDLPVEIKNEKASKVFPTIFTSGVFENLVTCIEEEKQVDYETSYEKDGQTLWFQATAIKLNDGVTVTTREITEEREKTDELKVLNEQLAIQNSLFKEAEELADIGSYVGYLDKDEAWISDNFYRILGHEPNDFEISFENYTNFVHPDDLELYEQIRLETITTGTSAFRKHRIITKDGTVKHLRVNGQNMVRDGERLSVGVVQDVTQEIKAEQKLKNKNQELIRSNAELESFNRVASHDLQEPMRKIQLFISRISEHELDKLSEKGRGYFEKIDNAANRMQTLIKYLLAYSRINRTKKDFVQVALNETLTKVTEDLEVRIKETNIDIAIDDLPTIKAIPFQMEQLFNNLISNAVKYRNQTEDPKVVIDCKKIPRSKITDDFDKKRKNYYRISVMDNGIGFDQENAEKIFGLFERLHQRDEYSGTGIGLAICKKIVENHKGHIVAESEKGKGATFCIYLPA